MSHVPAILPTTLAVGCLLAAGAAVAQDPPPPPPAAEEATPASPTKYESDAAAAWGQAPTPKPTAPGATQPRTGPEAEAQRKKCAEEKSKGLPLSPECQTSELDIVFQGAVRRPGPGVKAVPQAHDEESSRLHTDKAEAEETYLTDRDGKLDVWAVARREPPLLPEERSGYFAAGLNLGYSWLHGRGAEVDHAYNPVIHLGLEGTYQLFRLLQLALVADFDYLAGGAAAGYELMPPVSGDDYYRKEVGAILDNYVGLGLRPTLRVNVHFSIFEWAAGAGLGWHWFHTSGRWRTKVAANDPANTGVSMPPPIDSQPQWSGGADETIYSFEESDHGLYGVFETVLMARLLERRVGAGLFLQYTLPIHGGIVPDVTVESGADGQENDYAETFIRHLGSLSLLTLGLAADYRF